MDVRLTIGAIPHFWEYTTFWTTLGICAGVLFVCRFFVLVGRESKANEERKRRQNEEAKRRRSEELLLVQNQAASNHSIAGIVDASLFLEDTEEILCHKAVGVVLLEPKPVRVGGGLGMSVRVASGVAIRPAAGAAVSVDTWQTKSSGVLYVTNRRLVFDGEMENRTIPFDQVLSLRADSETLDVSLAKGRKKTMRFVGCNSQLVEWLVKELASGRLTVKQPTQNEQEGVCPFCNKPLMKPASGDGLVVCSNCGQSSLFEDGSKNVTGS